MRGFEIQQLFGAYIILYGVAGAVSTAIFVTFTLVILSKPETVATAAAAAFTTAAAAALLTTATARTAAAAAAWPCELRVKPTH